ncbi:hypothetical protein DACRYDRAFT_51594, partial [Dacryopinax primogenitus]
TDYKSQGCSLDHTIVDLARCQSPQSAYVMLSQVHTLHGLAILRDFDTEKIYCSLPSNLCNKIERLERLTLHTVRHHGT